MVITAVTAALLVLLAVAQWLCCWAWVVLRPGTPAPFVVSSVVLGLAVVLLSPSFASPSTQTSAASAPLKRGCAQVRDGMKMHHVYNLLGEPSSVVSEEDTQGPGGLAFVFADSRCIVRTIGDEVIAVDFE